MQKRSVVTIIGFVALALLVPKTLFAAELFFSPPAGTYLHSGTFTVGVYVESAEQTMNAAQGIVKFPTDKLQVVSTSRADSIVNLWIQEPTFSNANGTVSFEGIVLNPGYRGASGRIFSITFRPRAIGVATVRFQGGQVLANDGEGTAILDAIGAGRYVIITDVTAPTTQPAVESIEPPVFTRITKDIESGRPFIAQGQTYPNTRVVLWIKFDSEKEAEGHLVRSDADGKFTFVLNKFLSNGLYEFWAETVDEKGSKSLPTEPVAVIVQQPRIFLVGFQILNYLALILVIISVAFFFGFIFWSAWKKYFLLQAYVAQEGYHADTTASKKFSHIVEHIDKHINTLKNFKNPHNTIGQRIQDLDALKHEIVEAQQSIRDDVKDIVDTSQKSDNSMFLRSIIHHHELRSATELILKGVQKVVQTIKNTSIKLRDALRRKIQAIKDQQNQSPKV